MTHYHVGIDQDALSEAVAYWDGHRSVRIKLPDGRDIGLATTAYSFSLSDDQKVKVAQAIASAWNESQAGKRM